MIGPMATRRTRRNVSKKSTRAKASSITAKKRSTTKKPKKTTKHKNAPKQRAERFTELEAMLAPTAMVFAQEELEILSRAVKHPALGGAFIQRWSQRDRAGVPKRDLAAFKEAMAKVDVEARVRLVVKKLEKAWKAKLDADEIADVREDVHAMYRGE